jgi:hypothetical protein
MNAVKRYVDKHFVRSAFSQTTFEEFSKMYESDQFAKIGGIEKVYEELTGRKIQSDVKETRSDKKQAEKL